MTFKPFFCYRERKFFSAYGLYFVMFFGRYEKKKKKSVRGTDFIAEGIRESND